MQEFYFRSHLTTGIVQKFYTNQFNFTGVIGISLVSLEKCKIQRTFNFTRKTQNRETFSGFQRGPWSFREGNAEASTLLLPVDEFAIKLKYRIMVLISREDERWVCFC